MAGNFGYRAGRFLADHPAVVVIAVLALLLWQCTSLTKPVNTEAADQARIQADAAARQKVVAAQEEALVRKCTTEAQLLVDEARAHLKAGEPGKAFDKLNVCNGRFADPAAQKLLAESLTATHAAREKAAAKLRAETAKAEAIAKAKKKREGVSLGMSQDDVIASSWGKPRKINRTTNSSGVREQWVYDGGYLYFSNGVLTSVQN